MENLKISNLAVKHQRKHKWSNEARIQAVTHYLVLGNMALVSAVTKIPHQLLRNWKTQPWWNEYAAQIRAAENVQVDSKLTKIVDKSLDAVMDRLEKGDFVYNQKTGAIVRKPVNMKDAAKVTADMLTKRELLRGNATERKETTQVSVQDQLKALALEFAKWQNPTQKQPLPLVEIVEDDTIEMEQIDGISNQMDSDDGFDESSDLGEEEQTDSGDSGELGDDIGSGFGIPSMGQS